MRPAYAVEYDTASASTSPYDGDQANRESLFRGQINGTSGYEEAGAQGLVAGIKPRLKSRVKNS